MKLKFILASMLVILSLTSFSTNNEYKDGVYEGKSRSIYTSENFWGHVKVTIKDGKITNVEFKIVDATNNELFDDRYEKHYVGNDEYIKQCRNDWKGIQTYPDKFLKSQKIEEVDAVSGATWSYNMFRDSLNDALKKALK